MAATYEELMAKSRELYGAGDMEGAKRVARIALSRRGQVAGPVLSPEQSPALNPPKPERWPCQRKPQPRRGLANASL